MMQMGIERDGIAGLRKKVRSVILCTDREFKAKAVAFLNGAAFPAEKTTVEDIELAIDTLNQNEIMLNFVSMGLCSQALICKKH